MGKSNRCIVLELFQGNGRRAGHFEANRAIGNDTSILFTERSKKRG
jgi:hypothetical protein